MFALLVPAFGRAQGPYLVKDIDGTPGGSFPSSLSPVGDRIFFSAADPEYGREPRASEGTGAGTFQVAEFPSGSALASPAIAGNWIFFSIEDPHHGRELWIPGFLPQRLEFDGPTLEYEYPEDEYALTRVYLTVRTERGFERTSGEKSFCRAFPYRRGDANADGKIDISDPISIFAYVFISGRLSCLRAADVDATGTVNPADAVGLLGHLFLGGAPPVRDGGAFGRAIERR